ncbi:YdcF family protein [Magnetospira thiophila]
MRRSNYSRKPERGGLKGLLVLAVILLTPWSGGLLWFAGQLPEAPEQPDTPTDAIVVLTGGSDRLGAGLDLLAAGRAKKLFVSGVYRGVDVQQLLSLSRQTPEALACCIELGHGARDTIGNATETAEWAKANGVTSLRVVTASYHMPRTLLEFHHTLPGLTLIPHAVFPDQVKQDHWWMWPGTAKLIIGEYNKYLLAHLRLFLQRLAYRPLEEAP